MTPCAHSGSKGLHTLRSFAPKTSFWRDAQFDTLRLAFIQDAARVTERVTRIKVSLPSSYLHKASLTRFANSALSAAVTHASKPPAPNPHEFFGLETAGTP